MASPKLTALCLAALLGPILGRSTPPPASHRHTPIFRWNETKSVIAFGDSYTFVQGTLGLTNYSFIGSNLNFSYTPEQLLSDRIAQEDTYSTAERGPNWVEYLTKCGVHQGLTDPQTCSIQLWDFAYAGADVTVEYLPLHHNASVQLVNQTQQFLAYGQPVLAPLVDAHTALVAVWIGINDISDSSQYAVEDFPAFYDAIVTAMFEHAVEPVYQLGYRAFLFLNLPPLDRTPGNLVRAAGPLPNATMIGWWDDSLAQHASAFAATHTDATSLVFDTNTFLNHVLDNAAEFDITNTTSYCPAYDQPLPVEQYGCLPLDEYFWLNSGHMTSHVHAILAKEVEKFLGSSST